jgi:hypothetical protein
MPFFTGSTSDGSDMRQIFGVFTNPNNEDEWSTEPYNEEQKAFVREDNRQYRLKMSVVNYMKDNKLSLDDVRDLVVSKKSNLSKRQRDYVLAHYDSDGNFIEDDYED